MVEVYRLSTAIELDLKLKKKRKRIRKAKKKSVENNEGNFLFLLLKNNSALDS